MAAALHCAAARTFVINDGGHRKAITHYALLMASGMNRNI
jgi:hypothetical protein